MALIRKDLVLARTSNSLFFDPDGHPALDASELDFYMFDREARMDEAWGSVRGVAVEGMGSDRIQPPNAAGQRQNHHRIAELLREIAQPKLILIAVAMVKRWLS